MIRHPIEAGWKSFTRPVAVGDGTTGCDRGRCAAESSCSFFECPAADLSLRSDEHFGKDLASIMRAEASTEQTIVRIRFRPKPRPIRRSIDPQGQVATAPDGERIVDDGQRLPRDGVRVVHPRLVRTAAAAVRRIRGLVEGEHVDTEIDVLSLGWPDTAPRCG